MDHWNLTNSSTNNSKLSAGKLMLPAMRSESVNVSSIPASIFYPRSNIGSVSCFAGLEIEHANGTTTNNPANLLYGGGFEGSSDQESVDVEVSDHEALHPVEKKRRLSVEQVRSLELSFEMENKLEPERKKQLAHELGLQPRQVAVWFQNRRARWKTKQLERDYEALKSSYDTLVLENKRLQSEVANLVAKLEGKSTAALKEDVTIEHKLEVLTSNKSTEDELQEDAVTVGTVTTGKTLTFPPALEDMDVVVSTSSKATSKARKAEKRKHGSPCSDGYTSEILDAEYQAEAVPVVEDNMLPIDLQQLQPLQQQVIVPAAAVVQMDPAGKDVIKDEPDGMVYDPHSNQLVFYKFEDGLVYNEFDTASSSFYYSPDGFPSGWWT